MIYKNGFSSTDFETGYTYDLNGNITSLTRYDNTGILIDSLTFHYSGNRITRLSDGSGDVASVIDYPGFTSQKRFTCDDNGNVTIEPHKLLNIRLTAEYGKGFDYRNPAYMRQFYQIFPNMNALRSELSWTHYRILIRVDREQAREFYLQECIEGNWSTRQLERQINSFYFDRILMSSKKGRSLVKKEADDKKEVMQPEHIIKDPYVLEFLKLNPNVNFYEKQIEQALIDKLQGFLLELGKGFSFVSRQYRISAEDSHFYVDLVFYNYILKCFLLIDLKTDMKKRRKYDRELKQMVVELSNTRDNLSVLASELDIRAELIYRWRREALAEGARRAHMQFIEYFVHLLHDNGMSVFDLTKTGKNEL